jgi:hypothetical protein
MYHNTYKNLRLLGERIYPREQLPRDPQQRYRQISKVVPTGKVFFFLPVPD